MPETSPYTLNCRERMPLLRRYRAATSRALLIGTFFFATIAIVGAITLVFVPESQSLVSGVSLISGSLAAGGLLIFVFGTTYYPYRKPAATTKSAAGLSGDAENKSSANAAPAPVNVADVLSFDLLQHLGPYAVKPTAQSLAEALASLIESEHGLDFFRRLELDPAQVLTVLNQDLLPHFSWDDLARGAFSVASALDDNYITAEHIFASLFLQKELHNFIRQNSLTENDILFVAWWLKALSDIRVERARWWDKQQLLDFTGIGLSWASGFTPFVDQFARIPSGNLWDDPYGRFEQVESLINTLARQRQSNVLIVGQPGVGRLGVIKELARRVHANQAHSALNGQRVLYIHLGQLLGLAGNEAGQLAIIARALREMERAGNVIAILDGISSILGQSGEGRVNLSDVILPFFNSNKVRVVAIMSSDAYHLRFKSNEELLQLFEVVQVEPLSQQQTLQLLTLTVPGWERRTGVFLPYKSLRAVVESTTNVMPQIPFPEKAFDVLEESLVKAQSLKAAVLTEKQVHEIISHKVGFNVGRLQAEEAQHLLNLEDIIHERVVNQEQGVAAVARAMIRARAGVRSLKRPIGVFLFLGPTGVGKTETAKALAEAYFGSEEYLQRLDMSEFQGESAVERLIGSVQQPTGQLTSIIGDHPFAVLLLDEFEKSDVRVHQLFLQVFDEGHLSDARGKQYSFKHVIIVATSNAGAEFIRQHVQPNGTMPEGFEKKLREYILQQGIYRPELMNRFDGVVTFVPLTPKHIEKITILMLRKLNKQLDAQHGVTVAITPELVQFLVSIGYNPEFGARPMNRAIQNTVEYAVAQMLLRSQAQPGQTITLHPEQLATLVSSSS